ncbi:MAG: OmpH family outer membrane protein [Verrucomicrobiota bacterium]
MKLNLPLLLFTSLLGLAAIPGAGYGQISIAVVDVQEALNQYYKTEQQVEKINERAEELRVNIDERQAAYQQMTAKMAELDAKVRDTLLSEQVREEALEELQALAQERQAKAKEIADAQRQAQTEILEARQEMERTLVTEIRETVNAIAAAKEIDLIFDKSFLPKANKAIIYTSDKVVDLTEEIIATLNASKP